MEIWSGKSLREPSCHAAARPSAAVVFPSHAGRQTSSTFPTDFPTSTRLVSFFPASSSLLRFSIEWMTYLDPFMPSATWCCRASSSSSGYLPRSSIGEPLKTMRSQHFRVQQFAAVTLLQHERKQVPANWQTRCWRKSSPSRRQTSDRDVASWVRSSFREFRTMSRRPK